MSGIAVEAASVAGPARKLEASLPVKPHQSRGRRWAGLWGGHGAGVKPWKHQFLLPARRPHALAVCAPRIRFRPFGLVMRMAPLPYDTLRLPERAHGIALGCAPSVRDRHRVRRTAREPLHILRNAQQRQSATELARRSFAGPAAPAACPTAIVFFLHGAKPTDIVFHRRYMLATPSPLCSHYFRRLRIAGIARRLRRRACRPGGGRQQKPDKAEGSKTEFPVHPQAETMNL